MNQVANTVMIPREEYDALVQQRDELAEACRGLLNAHRITISKHVPDTVQQAERQLDAEAALAKVKK